MRITLRGKVRGRILANNRKVAALVFIVILLGAIFWTAPSISTSSLLLQQQLQQQQAPSQKKHLKIAFVGNSILFIHDGPGLLVAMLEASGDLYDTVEYDACLSAGASLVTLWKDHAPMVSGGCSPQFSTTKGTTMTMERLLVGNADDPVQPKQWDFVVMNDQTMAPAFSVTRRKSLTMLNTTYAPKLYQAGATPILLQTAAYRTEKAREVYGLGTFEGFTQKLTDGYQAYSTVLTDYFEQQHNLQQHSQSNRPYPTKAWIAPAGSAYAFLQHNPGKLDLFDKLYLDDDIHPSPYGTWLQSCVVCSTLTGKAPPRYNANFWKTTRGHSRTRYPVPSPAEGNALRDVAWQSVRTNWRAHGIIV